MIQEVKPGWLQNQIERTEIEMKANILVKEIISFSKRKEDVPTREEMYLILKQRSLDIQTKGCNWEDYYD